MKKILLALTAALFAGSAFSQHTDSLFSQYIRVKNALVNSDSKAAAEAAVALQKSVRESASFAQKSDLQAATDKLAAAKNIEKQRSAFADVSTMMWTVVKPSEAIKQEVYYQYCPMKKAWWLSTEPVIENPYYGASMLACGKVVESKN